ncbi:hypothetical protein ONZ45_g11305 [Pleurotus djamor]|nr:hypothetical protein ONZ45_g11305 [Pleurotus djamor]
MQASSDSTTQHLIPDNPSSITLFESPQHLVLQLNPDNPNSTTLTDVQTGQAIYNVQTTFKPKAVTTLINATTGEVIASWQWRDSRSDILTWKNDQPVTSSKWLKKTIVPFQDDVTFIIPGGTDKYTWKGNRAGADLELFSPHDSKSAIARFSRSHKTQRTHNDDETLSGRPTSNFRTVPAKLTIASSVVSSSSAQELLDVIVTSFLVLERKHRISEIGASRMVDMLGPMISAPASGMFT